MKKFLIIVVCIALIICGVKIASVQYLNNKYNLEIRTVYSGTNIAGNPIESKESTQKYIVKTDETYYEDGSLEQMYSTYAIHNKPKGISRKPIFDIMEINDDVVIIHTYTQSKVNDSDTFEAGEVIYLQYGDELYLNTNFGTADSAFNHYYLTFRKR